MQAYQDMVFSTAARMTGNEAQAEDIAQEVFLRAYEHFTQLRGDPRVGGWLKTVTTRLTLNHLSRYRKRRRFFSELVTDDEGNDDQQLAEFGATDAVVAELDADQRRLLVEQALCRLPEHQRVPIVLYHFESMSYQQISDLLHVSLPKVKTDIQRARAALAKALGRVGIVRTSLGD